jgi:hypothetical protein
MPHAAETHDCSAARNRRRRPVLGEVAHDVREPGERDKRRRQLLLKSLFDVKSLQKQGIMYADLSLDERRPHAPDGMRLHPPRMAKPKG